MSLFVTQRPVVDEKPTTPTVFPAYPKFELKRGSAFKPFLALVPRRLHIIRKERTKASGLDLFQAQAGVFEHQPEGTAPRSRLPHLF